MKTRKDLPHFLNLLHLINEGAEIGVQTGRFSKWILQRWEGRKLYSIDPWTHQESKMDVSDVSQEEHDRNFMETQSALKEFKSRSSIIRETSNGASARFGPEQLDFVYLDAKHDYRSVWNDLAIWYSKVRKGGIIAGHDYKNSCVRKNLVEVKRAVDNFFRTCTGNKKILTTIDDNLPSWYVIK